MSALYQKYRPQKFSEVVNQTPVKRTIMNQLANNTLGHAYLFAGPRGVGKTTMARLLARAVNCLNRKTGEAEPCNACLLCKEIQAGRCLDIIEVDAASHTGVDHVRDNIIAAAQVGAGTANRYKVFIIDEAHMLSTSAFNALLKTLEEPPRQVLFILATTELHKLPATIISRCQRFNFSKIGPVELVARLTNMVKQEKRKVDENVLQRLAKQSDGCLRDAEVLLGQVLAITDGRIGDKEADLVLPRHDIGLTLDFIEQTLNGQVKEAMVMIGRLSDEGVEPEIFIDQLMTVVRELMIQTVFGEPQQAGVTAEVFAFWQSIPSDHKSPERLAGVLNALQNADRQSKDSPIPQLPLELLVIDLNRSQRSDQVTLKPVSPPGAARAAAIDTVGVREPKIISVPNVPVPSATVDENAPAPSDLTLKDIQTKWSSFLELLSEEARSLSFIFGVSQPLSLVGQKLKVGLQYTLHRERLLDKTVKKQVEELAAKIFGARLEFEPVVREVEPLTSSDEADVKEVLAAFGGQIIK